MALIPTANLRIKKYESNIFLYDSLRGNIVKAGARLEETVGRLKLGQWDGSFENQLQPLIEKGLLHCSKAGDQKATLDARSTGEFYNLRFHVSNRCNHECNYCHVFGSGASRPSRPALMDYRIMRAGLDAYAALVKGRKNQVLDFSFYGGEPLFNWPAIKKALAYGNDLLGPENQVTWILNTNGTLITPARAQTLAREGVDVHLSIDGPDDCSNQNRRYKSGRPVLSRVLETLDILRDYDCQIQFDSCLTASNWDDLEALIDLAAVKGVDRIYLALTDQRPASCSDSPSPPKIARRLVRAMVYGEQKNVAVGGPWKCFFPWLLPPTDYLDSTVPHLIVDPTGELYLPSFAGQKLGHVSRLSEILVSAAYDEVLRKQHSFRKTCRGCELEGICAGYLKGMVRYHTGSLQGHEKECEVARAAFDEYLRYLADANTEQIDAAVTLTDITLLEKPMIHSRHLKVEWVAGRQRLTHGLSGRVIEVSTDMIEFIDAFKEVTRPTSLWQHYDIPNLLQIVQGLMRNHVLIPVARDEELEHLHSEFSATNKGRFETRDCLCLCPAGCGFPADKFAHLIQKLYSNFNGTFRPLRQKMIIYLCDSREEVAQFWYERHLPPWINGFVALRRALVLDAGQIENDDWERPGFKAGMTHEIIHMLLGNLNISLPIWLEEGICEYFSKSDPIPRLRQLTKKKKLLRFAELEAKTVHTLLDIDNSKTDDNICYRQAHGFVAYLCNALGEDNFINWIETLGFNADLMHSFSQCFDQNLADLEQTWLHQLTS